jgi:N-acetylmuramate 1-kinase
MKLEQTERLFVEDLFNRSVKTKKIQDQTIDEIERLSGDASTRRYYRIRTDLDSYVVCLDNPQKDPNVKNEFIQIQKIFKKEKVRVPGVYHILREKGYILEEDLGDKTLLKELAGVVKKKDERLLYEKSIEEMINIHSINYENYPEQTFSKLSFDVPKLMYEVNFSIDYFLKGFLTYKGDEKIDKILEKEFYEISQRIAKERKVVTHRDYHSRNIMIKEGQQVIIDFQDARLGIPQYDLASLLDDCYYKIDEENKNFLKKLYWENFAKPNVKISSYEDFEILYDYVAIQRIFKALGSFAFIYKQRKDERYLKHIGYSFENLRTFLSKYKRLNSLKTILSELYYEH